MPLCMYYLFFASLLATCSICMAVVLSGLLLPVPIRPLRLHCLLCFQDPLLAYGPINSYGWFRPTGEVHE